MNRHDYVLNNFIYKDRQWMDLVHRLGFADPFPRSN